MSQMVQFHIKNAYNNSIPTVRVLTLTDTKYTNSVLKAIHLCSNVNAGVKVNV